MAKMLETTLMGRWACLNWKDGSSVEDVLKEQVVLQSQVLIHPRRDLYKLFVLQSLLLHFRKHHPFLQIDWNSRLEKCYPHFSTGRTPFVLRLETLVLPWSDAGFKLRMFASAHYFPSIIACLTESDNK